MQREIVFENNLQLIINWHMHFKKKLITDVALKKDEETKKKEKKCVY